MSNDKINHQKMSDDEINEYIKKHYPHQDSRDVAKALGMSVDTLYARANYHGITKSRGRKSKYITEKPTAEQLERARTLIRERYAYESMTSLAEQAGLHTHRMHQLRIEMGISKIDAQRAAGVLNPSGYVCPQALTIYLTHRARIAPPLREQIIDQIQVTKLTSPPP